MEYAFRKSLIRVLLVITALALIANMAWAQAGVGELSGLVTDPQGAVVSGVTVTLSNSATGSKRTTTTNSVGLYRFSALPIVGAYSLELTPSGFRSVKVESIIVTVATVTTRDVKLEVGTSNEQVTVEANTQQVQTNESSISQLVDRRVWEQMPLETRSQNEFINTVAGAVPQIFDDTARGAAVNGTRTGTGNYLVEGADNNEQGQGGVTIGAGQGGANTSISPDAIQEYRVITHDFNAEYGKAGGFVTDTVLKSGTNQWHGSLFEYNRVQALAANDFFSNRAGIQDGLVRNQFGGSVGGPIIKDKTFFYSSVEFHRLRQSKPVTGVSYTHQFYDFVNSGAFEQFMESDPGGYCPQIIGSACPGGFSQSSTVGPIFKDQQSKFPQAMPLANSSISTADCAAGDSACSGEGLFTGGQLGFPVIQYPVPLYDSVTESDITPLNQYRVSLKVDHKISDHDQINGVYLLEDAKSSSNIDGGDTTFGVPLENPNRAQTASISWTHTFSPNVLNQAKIGYVRRLANFIAPGTDGIPGLLTIDALSSGFGGSTALPQFFTENEFQYKDDLSASKGRHSFKFGGEYRRTRNGSSFDSDKFGHFWSWGGEDLITDSVFSDEADLLYFGKPYYGTWYSAGAAVNPTNGAIPDFYRGYRANEFGAFGQDDWKVTPRLTMNLGVRWDYFGPPHNFQDGVDSNFYFGTGTTPVQTVSTNPYFPANDPLYAKEATGGFQQRNSNIWAKDYNNFGPRVGFSWDVFGTQKVVVRSGFGMFYDRIYNNLFENIRFNPPGYCDCTAGSLLTGVPAGAIETPGLFAVPFTANSSFIDPALFPNGLPKATPRHMDENLVAPYYEQWSFGLQYDLGHNLILETNYLGTAGRKLIGIRNINTFDGRVVRGLSTTRINSTIGSDNYRSNDYGSNYHALEATLRKQFSSGLTFNANYTWSKALDDISDAFRAKGSTAVTDPMNIHLDYGPADFDIRNRFVGSFNYDLPFMKANRFLGGWTLNGIFSINSGAAVALLDSSGDYNKNGLFGERPAYVGPGTITNAYLGKNPADGYLNPDDFGQVTCPADVNGGQWCNSTTGRGSLHGPTYVNFDFGVGKSFKITESSKLTLQGNFFDIFNHPNFQNPQGDIQSANFGKAEDTFGDNGGHRVIQLSLRFDF